MSSLGFGFVSGAWVLVGAFAFAATTHLQYGLRPPRSRLHTIFGLLTVLAAYGAATLALMVGVESPKTYELAAKHQSCAVVGIFILLPWFVRDYVGQVQRWPAATVSTLYAIVLAVSLTLPHSMLLSESPTLTTLILPWGEPIVRAATPPHTWLNAFWISHFATIAFVIYGIAFAFRHRSASTGRSLAITTAPFLASLVVNISIGFGLIKSMPFVGTLGFMAMLLAMSVVLSEALRRSSRQMQVVLDNVPAVVYVKHADGRYAFVNRKFEELHDIAAARAVGANALEFDSAHATPERVRSDNAALVEKRSIEREESLIVTSQSRTLSWIHFPLLNQHGEAYAVCGVGTDITLRKSHDAMLQELANTLERRVARRTQELAQVNKELEAFVYSVSHDLRAPLTAINGFAELLLREHAVRLDQNASRYLTRIRDGSVRMAAIIQDLLGLSRVTQQSLDRHAVDMSAIAQSVVKTLQDSEPNRIVDVVVASNMSAYGDANLLNLTMTNLIGNAWKYTSKTSNARIEVGADRQNNETIFCVRDNGAGFNPDYVDRLFRPFVRLHPDSEFSGTGIGLATAARIVNRHGGRVWAEGSVGEGATFYFSLPDHDDEQPSNFAQSDN